MAVFGAGFRQKAHASVDFKGTRNPIANEGTKPDEIIVLSQLTRAQQEEQAARLAAIAAVEAALGTEREQRVAGDLLAESRLQQAIEGVSKRTVAARYDGTATPTMADVPGIDEDAPATDWRSWFLWDRGAASEDTGIYTFQDTETPVRVDTVAMEAGLLVFVNDGEFRDTQWLMIDDPGYGGADFVPWQRVSEFTATAPIYKQNNIVRLAWDAGFLAVRANPDTGLTELTIAPTFRQRVSDLEVDVDNLQSRLALEEQLNQTQNARLGTAEQTIGTIQLEQTTQNNRLNAAESDIDTLQAEQITQNTSITSLGNRITRTESDIYSIQDEQINQNSLLDAHSSMIAAERDRNNEQATQIQSIQSEQVVQNTRLTTAEGEIDALQAEQVTQNTRIGTAETDIDAIELEQVTQNNRLTTAEGEIDALQAEQLTQNNRITTTEQNVSTIQAEQVVQNTRIGAAEGEIDALQSEQIVQNNRLGTAEADIDAIESEQVTQNNRITTAETEIDTLQAEQIVQNTRLGTAEGEIDALQAEQVTQNNQLTQLRTDVDTKTTLAVVQSLIERLNPIHTLRNGVSIRESDGFYLTTFRIDKGEPDFKIVEIFEGTTPFEAAPEFLRKAYPGNVVEITFQTGASDGPIPDGRFSVQLAKGFRVD
ncbi:MAG TPA: hypothetical protein V6D33_12625 [Cyanophyceae cyanobacterium]